MNALDACKMRSLDLWSLWNYLEKNENFKVAISNALSNKPFDIFPVLILHAKNNPNSILHLDDEIVKTIINL